MAGSAVATITVSIVAMKLLAIIDENASLKAKDFFSIFSSVFPCGMVRITDFKESCVVVVGKASCLGEHFDSIFKIG